MCLIIKTEYCRETVYLQALLNSELSALYRGIFNSFSFFADTSLEDVKLHPIRIIRVINERNLFPNYANCNHGDNFNRHL